MSPTRFVLTIFLLLFIVASASVAQQSQKITLENMNEPALTRAFVVPSTWWLDDNSAVILDTVEANSPRVLKRLDHVTGTITPLYDYEKARRSLVQLISEDSVNAVSFVPAAITGSGKYGYYLIAGDIFLVELANGDVLRVTNTPDKEKSVNFSPDGLKLAFIRKNDLYMYDIGTKKETRLTTDGTDSLLNGTLTWVYWEEIFGRQDTGYWWSKDSRSIAFLQTNEAGVSIQHYVDITPWTPTVTTQRYPKVGEKNPDVKLGIIAIGSGKTVWAAIDPATYEYITRVDWLPDGKRILVRTLNRLQTKLDFHMVTASTGTAAFIMQDTDEGWINMSDDMYFTNDEKYFITSSERDGYEHLYRFTLDGKLVNQITKGPWRLSSSALVYWVKKAIAGVDEKNGWIYFTALEKSSVEKHLYRISMDGKGMKRLTQETGTHVVSMSHDARFYFDKFSNVTTLPSLTLYDVRGEKKRTFPTAADAALATYDLQYTELLDIPARDGFLLPSSILKPKVLEPGKKYPVIVFVYGGPSAPTVSNSLSAATLWENVLVTNGFLLMKVDNRASTAKSKTLENLLLYKSIGKVELNDLVDGVRWMKEQPYADPDRFGIYGWSGGGTNTILAMTQSNEFKAGIAGAGVTDFRLYDSKWAEAMMKTEKENKEGYDRASLIQYAKNLHGKLMLIHGTHDDNVHPQNTWLFENELIKAGKLFEMMIYPMRGHGFTDRAAKRHRDAIMLDFWKRNL